MAVEKRNIFLANTAEATHYASPPRRGRQFSYPERNIKSHANLIQTKLRNSYEVANRQKQAAAIRYKDGVYLEFSSATQYDLAIQSLENRKEGIRLLNVRKDAESETMKATVYIPAGKESYFLKKAEAYATQQTISGKPKNNDLISSIEDVKLAILDSFWIGDKNAMPTSDPVWCEVWLRYDYRDKALNVWEKTETSFLEICKKNKISVDDNRIIFPERIVKLVRANEGQLKIFINKCPYIAEIRRAQEPTTFFEKLPNPEQREWIDELLERTYFQKDNVAICLLDTGLTSAHPLLKRAIQNEDSIQTVESAWGIRDHHGHGTEMAGIALYKDLKQVLEDTRSIFIPHKLESVKILPPKDGNPYELYGAITQQAVSIAEISNPNIKRILCMAVTSSEHNTGDGSPTSWSASIDNITSAAEEESEKRLFFISSGNVDPDELAQVEYPKPNILHSVESPGQAWNAVTVGAYSQNILISDPIYKDYSAVADTGELSPYSSTSTTWSSKWPIKPDILLDGGNIATNGFDFTGCADLSLLTTNYRPLLKQFSTISGTSSATAQAAWMGAQLLAEYPDAWPETIRALIIHSASWTDKMKEQFCSKDTKTKGRRLLLRTCGYGIPDLEKAIQCMNNSVNLVVQCELQPFKKDSMNEMHFHKLPWPQKVLRSLGEVPVSLKVTLSYFIEPGPGEVGWKNKYRYPSCGLRFDVINANETPEDFKKRINVKMRGEDKKDKGEGGSGSERWYLGSDNRDVGSIHSDFCELSAVDLCDCNYIAVFPVIGWWRERAHLGKYSNKVRYSMIISLSTPETSVDLYTPIITEIKNAIEIDIEAL
ncbi:MAG: S8 family peptidase [Saccharofermentanales bacterium]|jgi:hypothetical protein